MIVIFTGPSLHPDAAKSLLDAVILPPVKRGDLDQFRNEKPQAIGIIDGEFYQQLALSPKEILPFLDAGVPVYGASSMGALRAAELHPHGMIGVGRVFRLFKSGVLDADDEVALTYCPTTYQPVSEPLVNTRYVLRAALREKLVSRAQVAAILDSLKRTYFPERTRRLLIRLVGDVAGEDATSRMTQLCEAGVPNIKEQDARMLIKRIGMDVHLAPRPNHL